MRCVITGGTGFVGVALGQALRARGEEVVALSRNPSPALAALGIEHQRADIGGDLEHFREAFTGVDAVFHVAAKVDMWGAYEDFERTNVRGTENILRACREESIPFLVYTSSPSVIADGTDLRGVDERYPYPKRYDAFYPQTKAQAEQMVLAVNGDNLKTIALRPHLIWGPNDTNLVPTILTRAKANRLVQVGAGKNIVDTSFIDDCVAAHILALDSLASGKHPGGKAYFISQGEPVALWDWINDILRRNDLPPVKRKIPRALAYVLASAAEVAARIIPGGKEPLLTRFLVDEMATDHYFDISAARRDLGYRPQMTIAEGMDRTFSGTSSAKTS